MGEMGEREIRASDGERVDYRDGMDGRKRRGTEAEKDLMREIEKKRKEK